MTFEQLSTQEYQRLTQDATSLKQRGQLPSVLLNTEQQIIKHIYPRPWPSSSKLRPYAARFEKNAKLLTEKGIKTPTVNQVYYYPELNCDILVYEYLNGDSLYHHAKRGDLGPLSRCPSFIAHLHRIGVYFHDLHLDNLVVHAGQLALIDLSSAQIKSGAISSRRRARNIAHLFQKREDQPILAQYGEQRWLREYMQAAKLSKWEMRLFRFFLKRRCSWLV